MSTKSNLWRAVICLRTFSASSSHRRRPAEHGANIKNLLGILFVLFGELLLLLPALIEAAERHSRRAAGSDLSHAARAAEPASFPAWSHACAWG